MVDSQRAAAKDLPDMEAVTRRFHELRTNLDTSTGSNSRRLASGEELHKPYDELSDAGRESERAMVRLVYEAISTEAEEDLRGAPNREVAPGRHERQDRTDSRHGEETDQERDARLKREGRR